MQSRWQAARSLLFEARSRRIPPLKDDKILTDWNGLMIAALAAGSLVLGREDYKEAAVRAARFILTTLRAENGRLLHRFRDGERAIAGHAGDYAFLIHGLLHLYRATFDIGFAEEAAALQQVMVADFWDEDAGGFFLVDPHHLELPVRPKELYDGALPSANSVALTNLLWLSRLTGETRWAEKAQELVRAFAGSVSQNALGLYRVPLRAGPGAAPRKGHRRGGNRGGR